MKTAAFSLIELIIVIAIISILASISLPIYSNHLTKMHRHQAAAALLDLASRLEHYYIEHHSYDTTLSKLDVINDSKYYTLEIDSATENAFQIRAILSKPDVCGDLILDQAGNKQCWQ